MTEIVSIGVSQSLHMFFPVFLVLVDFQLNGDLLDYEPHTTLAKAIQTLSKRGFIHSHI